MKNSEFPLHLTSNTSKTKRIRTYTGKWHTGARQIAHEVQRRIGAVVAVLQANLDKICLPNEFILIYNVQPVHFGMSGTYVSINYVRKPLADIAATGDSTGKIGQVLVDPKSGDVMNCAMALQKSEIEDMSDEENAEEPTVYGNFHTAKVLCSFAAIVRQEPFENVEDVFSGQYDHTDEIRNSMPFDCLIDSRAFLDQHTDCFGRYSAEFACDKADQAALKATHFGKWISKIIKYPEDVVVVNHNQEASAQEKDLHSELIRLKDSLNVEEY